MSPQGLAISQLAVCFGHFVCKRLRKSGWCCSHIWLCYAWAASWSVGIIVIGGVVSLLVNIAVAG
ncbi:hypothetical protein QQ41_05225 [Streptococcus equi subsp. zooepidemicus]|nr:hypothetical protein QQ41_05225 [Streptococcus equi subsp. zooepidemicus]